MTTIIIKLKYDLTANFAAGFRNAIKMKDRKLANHNKLVFVSQCRMGPLMVV